MLADVGGPLGPIPWLLELARLTALTAWLLFRRITLNVAQLGPAWAICYWVLVVWLLALGSYGSGMVRATRRGNDYLEFDPARRGGAWVGSTRVRVIRWQIKVESAWAVGCFVAGYGGACALLVVGLVWVWLVPFVGYLALVKSAQFRRRARRRATQ